MPNVIKLDTCVAILSSCAAKQLCKIVVQVNNEGETLLCFFAIVCGNWQMSRNNISLPWWLESFGYLPRQETTWSSSLVLAIAEWRRGTGPRPLLKERSPDSCNREIFFGAPNLQILVQREEHAKKYQPDTDAELL